MNVNLTKQKKFIEDVLTDLKRTHADELASLQAELQQARFEKNSIRDQITETGEFASLNETVQKL